MKSAILIATLLCFILCINGESFFSDEDLSLTNTFDFIVVGTGASGSVVAARLANETTNTVLVLEGGRKGTGQRDIGGTDYVASYFKTDPITGKQVLDRPLTRYDVPTMADSIRLASDVLDNIYNITSIGPFTTQAKVVGGNQATNGLVWYSPRKRDLDNLGIPEYSGDAIHNIIARIENATETGYGNDPGRGNAGPIGVTFASFRPFEQLKFRDLLLAQGYQMGGDFNTGVMNASTIYFGQNSVKRGIRQTSSIGYLAKVIGKRNLVARAGCIVTRVIFDSSDDKKAIGVEYANEHGVLIEAYARKEVILSAGDIQIPKILYNSGIGPLSILKAFNKPPRVVNELIGQKIRNHQRVSMAFNDSTLPVPNYYVTPAASIQYARYGTGIEEARGLMFVYLNSTNCTIQCPDLSVNLGTVSGSGPSDVYSQSFQVTIGLGYNLYANGSVNLTDENPLGGTIFRANTFLLDQDVTRLANGVFQVRQIMSQWGGNLVEVDPGPSYTTLAQVKQWVKSKGSTNGHYHGSVPMGTDDSSPVDTRMKVRGVTGLRVVGPAILNGFVFPGMQALATALGELGTDFIKQDYGL